MSHSYQLKGLYAITPERPQSGQRLIEQVKQAIDGGARIIQYRDKSQDAQRRLDEAHLLVALCQSHNIPLLINDDVNLAKASHAAGVHLGRNDASLEYARQELGKQAIIGMSCYNQFELAQQAETAGADYIAFGRFFSSDTKPQAIQADLALLETAHQHLTTPLVAIGGITPENGAALIQAGAHMLAVVQGVFGQADIRKACHQFTTLFDLEELP